MADPAELIRNHYAAIVDCVKFADKNGGERRILDAEAALLAALTPQPSQAPSADDVALVDDFEDAVRNYEASDGGTSEHKVSARTELNKARAAVLARMAGKVPEGWKLVPVEPTEKMMEAIDAVHDGEAAFLRQTGGNVTQASWADAHRRAYAAMLAAAPEAPR